jgi:hypothetical protein
MTARTTETTTATQAAAWGIAPTEAAARDEARTAHAAAARWGRATEAALGGLAALAAEQADDRHARWAVC